MCTNPAKKYLSNTSSSKHESRSTQIFELAPANITNFLNDVKDAEVAIVANGFAVKLFVEKANLRLKDRLKELNERGVKFYVCNDALNLHLPSCSG